MTSQNCAFMLNRKLNHALILSSLQPTYISTEISDSILQKYNKMLESLHTSNVPKKIAFTANLGIIQFLKNMTRDSFTNLKIVKDMMKNPEAYGYTSKEAKLKSTDILDQINNMAVFEYLNARKEGGAMS